MSILQRPNSVTEIFTIPNFTTSIRLILASLLQRERYINPSTYNDEQILQQIVDIHRPIITSKFRSIEFGNYSEDLYIFFEMFENYLSKISKFNPEISRMYVRWLLSSLIQYEIKSQEFYNLLDQFLKLEISEDYEIVFLDLLIEINNLSH